MAKSTILDTIEQEIIFLFKWYLNFYQIVTLKGEKREKLKCPKIPHLFLERTKKDVLV